MNLVTWKAELDKAVTYEEQATAYGNYPSSESEFLARSRHSIDAANEVFYNTFGDRIISTVEFEIAKREGYTEV